jgi:hypothetical protein
VHELGPRPVGVLLLQIAGDDRDLIERLERLAAFDPQTVAALGGRDWPRPPLWSVPSEA